MKVDPQGFPRKWVARSVKLKPFQPAEWHNMCADRAHAGVTMWAGKIPPVKWINRVALVEVSQRFGEPREKANKEKTTMKKLMVIAAAAALAATAEAGIAVTNCNEVVNPECPNVVFKITASGKIVEGASKEYKTVSKLKISKGALVLFGTGSEDCCYDTYSLYLPVKVGKETKKVLVSQEAIECWTIFGKKLEAAQESYSKNKKFKLDSEIGISYNGTPLDGDDPTEDLLDGDLTFIATAIGKVTYKYAAAAEKKGACQTGCSPEDYDVVPGNYSGWFAGFYPASGDELCLTCACNELDVYGGTWKAKYDKSASVKNGWRQAASYAFGAATVAKMVSEEVE